MAKDPEFWKKTRREIARFFLNYREQLRWDGSFDRATVWQTAILLRKYDYSSWELFIKADEFSVEEKQILTSFSDIMDEVTEKDGIMAVYRWPEIDMRNDLFESSLSLIEQFMATPMMKSLMSEFWWDNRMILWQYGVVKRSDFQIRLDFNTLSPKLTKRVSEVESWLPMAWKGLLTNGNAPLILGTPESIRIGLQAPDFSLSSEREATFTLSKLKGQHVLIRFTSSTACNEEKFLPILHHFREMGFFLVNIVLEEEEINSERFEAASIHLFARGGWENEVVKLYDVQAVPAYFLIDPAGDIIAYDGSPRDIEEKWRRG